VVSNPSSNVSLGYYGIPGRDRMNEVISKTHFKDQGPLPAFRFGVGGRNFLDSASKSSSCRIAASCI
jgi:hypothetical protein